MAETAMHILLIEDETAHAEIIRRAFEVYTKPVRLTVTSSLQQARTRLAEFVPDLIIADLRLPDGDGFELLPGEKEEARYPVVIMTSHGDEKAAVETMKAGAFDYVVKSDDTLAAMPHMAERALREWGNIVERRRAEAELEGRARQQAVVAGLGQSALAETDLMVLMNETVCLVSETLEVEHCEILELLPGGNHLFMRAGAGWQEGLVGIATVEVITDSHAGFTLQADGPVIVAELQSETRFKAPLLLQRHGVVSGMSVNIAGHEGPFGILGAYSRQRRIFSKNDSHFLQAMANVLAAAIGRIRAEENIRHRNRELTLLNRVIAASAASSELESILETVCLELTRAFDLSQAVIALLNREKMVVEVAAERLTEDSPSLLKQPIPIANNPLVEYLSHHKAPLAIEDAQNEPLLVSFHNLLHQRATISVLILPLIVEDKLVGALSLGATQPRTFTPEEINLTGRVAEQVAGVLARASLDEERRRLEAQYQQAQKMESVGRLAAGIAHDFNNLLTAINGFAELMQYRLDSDDRNRKFLELVLQSGQRAAELISQLLAFSRKQIINPTFMDLNAIVAKMGKMLERVIGEDIKLETHLASDLWPIMADPAQMEQIIVNLAVNARDAMPDGGRLTIETANVQLVEKDAIYLEIQAGKHIRLAISDTGIGMSDEVKVHVFEPFFTTKEVGKGTGLGLATVYGIVKQSQGSIQVFSKAGSGTTFEIYLPHAEKIEPSTVHPETEVKMPFGTETILLVEDDFNVRELARIVLQGQGYTLLEAQDGQEALHLARHYAAPIHLLLTDVIMPGMTGKALADQIAELQPDIKIMFITGYTDEMIVRHQVLAPDVILLQKPFSPVVLTQKIRSVLDGQE